MRIAVVADKGRETVPHCYEKSRELLIVETDTEDILWVYENQDHSGCYFGEKIVAHSCEAVVCGVIQRAGFEAVADFGVTRYNGSGLSVMEALRRAVENQLPFITDYEGGPGCGSGGGACHDHGH